MSELDDAIARLERAVERLEAAPRLNQPEPAGEDVVRLAEARLAQDRAAEDERVRQLTAAIAARVEAALDKIGLVLREDG